jgi:CHAT domain-containing protein
MSEHRILFVILAFCLVLPLATQLQDAASLLQREEDERVTTVEERQRVLATLLSRAIDLRNSGQPLEAARNLNRAGAFQIRLYRPEDAIATFHEALKLLELTPDLETEVDSLNGLGLAYHGLSECKLARLALDKAIVLSKQADYKAGHAQALLPLSDCQNYDDHGLALRSAHDALNLWTALGDKRGMAEAHGLIASYEMSQNKLAESKLSYEIALPLWRELNAADEQAGVLINLGFIEFRKGAWQESLAFYTQAQHLLDEKTEPYKMGQIAAGLAESFVESGLPEVGLEKFRQALEYYRLTKNPRAMIAMGWGIGKAQYLSGHYPQALDSLHNARTEAAAIKESMVVAMCDDFLGRTYYALDDTALALRHFQSALDGYTKTKSQIEVARTRALMGQVYQQQGSLEKAESSYQGALQTFRTLSDRVNESATLYALGGLALELNNLDEAEDYLRLAIEITEDMRRVSTSSDLTAAFSATVHDRYEAYIDCLMRKHRAQPDRGFAALALETSELGRARSLGEILRTTATGFAPGVDPQLVAQEKSLRQSLRVMEDQKVRLLGGAYKREELASLDSDLARLEKEYKQVTETIHARYPAFEKLTRPGVWKLGEIQSQVIADYQTVLLEYSLGADKSYVWAVTREGLKSYELPPQREINEAAGNVQELLATEPTPETVDKLTQATIQAAHKLSEMVLSPVASELNKSRIIVVADGALNYIPFQVLPAPSAPGQQLVESYEVVNAPSASVLGQLRQETSRRERPSNVLAAFGDPVFLSNFAQQDDREVVAQLPATQKETESRHSTSRDIQPTGDVFDPATIEQLVYAPVELSNLRKVAGSNTLLATRFDATRDKLRAADLTQYSILHLATHGFLDPKHPEKSGLVLSTLNKKGQTQNGFVGLNDIYSLRAPVDLVVLSACRTGLGKDVRGEGLIGLTRGFIYAGASSVVASLWKVDDEATAELMKRFYTNMLQRGMRPAEALRAAQNSIRQEPQWRAPYYWAAFTLQGEYLKTINQPALTTNGYQKLLVGVFCLALLSAGGWWYFYRARGRYSRAKM